MTPCHGNAQCCNSAHGHSATPLAIRNQPALLSLRSNVITLPAAAHLRHGYAQRLGAQQKFHVKAPALEALVGGQHSGGAAGEELEAALRVADLCCIVRTAVLHQVSKGASVQVTCLRMQAPACQHAVSEQFEAVLHVADLRPAVRARQRGCAQAEIVIMETSCKQSGVTRQLLRQ